MSQYVIDVTEANFQQEVLQYSQKAPVVVDFWAEWCGPCRALGPMLERLAEKHKGAFRLAKLDVDQNQRLAAAFGVQSIPMVVALYQGQAVDQFMGAQPQAEVQRFIERLLAAAGIEEEEEAPRDPKRAEAYWRERLKKDEEDKKAALELAHLLIADRRIDDAKVLLEGIKANHEQYDAARSALAMLDLLSEVGEAGGEAVVRDQLTAQPGDPHLRYLVACAEAGRGQYGTAVRELVELVASGPAEVRDKAKKAAGIIFTVAGRGDEEVEAQRRRLSLLLF